MEKTITKWIPLFRVYMANTVKSEVLRTLYSGYVGQGPKVEEFEKAIANYIGCNFVLSVNAGTHAIHLALVLAGIDPDHEVITTPLSCFATTAAILMCGAKPVWCDIDPNTANIDHKKVESLITERTKAILIVHWGGYPCELDYLNVMAEKHGLSLIEDAAHAFGAEYYGVKIGKHSSDYTCFSYQAIKHVSTCDGGALIVNNVNDYKRAKLLRWYGIDRESPRTDLRCEENIDESGFKYHMNDVNATIGLENLKRAEEILEIHRANAGYYNGALSDMGGITLMREDPNILSSYWLYTIKVENRDAFVKMMNDKGIMVSRVHVRTDQHSCVGQFKKPLPILDEFEKRYCCIPVGWWVSKEDREYIVDCIRKGW